MDGMQQVNVKFNSVDQIRQFVNIIGKFESNFDLGSGQRIVDAKSILGVMALDLTGPVRLRCHSDDTEIAEKIAPFLCWIPWMPTGAVKAGSKTGFRENGTSHKNIKKKIRQE